MQCRRNILKKAYICGSKVCQSIRLSIHLYICLPVNLIVDLSSLLVVDLTISSFPYVSVIAVRFFSFFRRSVKRCVCFLVLPSIDPSIYQTIYEFMGLLICLFAASLSIATLICFPMCLSIHLIFSPFVCRSTCRSIHLFVGLFVCLSICLTIPLSASRFGSRPLYLSIRKQKLTPFSCLILFPFIVIFFKILITKKRLMHVDVIKLQLAKLKVCDFKPNTLVKGLSKSRRYFHSLQVLLRTTQKLSMLLVATVM